MKQAQPYMVYLYRRMVQAKLYIDANYHQPIDLNDIAHEAYFSKFHFIRLFKSTCGKTPHQYLIAVRIEKARLLLQTEMAVSDVCFAVGFTSIGSFTDLFKRLTKITPAAYQQQQLKRKLEIIKTPLKFIPNCFARQNGWLNNSNFQEV